MIKRLNNAKRQTNYLVCNIEVSDSSRWDRYLGITAPMTQVSVPTAKTLLLTTAK